MALISCPECDKQISDKAETCPHCGIKLKTFKNHEKYSQIICKHCNKTYVGSTKEISICPYCKQTNTPKINSKKFSKPVFALGGIFLCICLIAGILFIKNLLEEKQEKELYSNVLQAQQEILDQYGDDIEPIQAIYLYRNFESDPPSEELSEVYDTGYYVYLKYNIKSEEESFIWHDGDLLFNESIPQDFLYQANAQLRELQALEFLLLLSETPEKTVEEINNKTNGMCDIDVNILKKYVKYAE